MDYRITNATLIIDLAISNTARNRLESAKIDTVEKLLALSDEDIRHLPRVGKKTADEIIAKKNSILAGELTSIEADHRTMLNILQERTLTEEYAEIMFMGADGYLFKDLPITVMKITPAKMGALIRNGIETLKTLSLTEKEAVKNIKSIGKTFDDIVDELDQRLVVCFPINQTFRTASMVADWVGEEFAHDEALRELIENAVRMQVYEYEEPIFCETFEEFLENQNLLIHIYRDETVRSLVEEYIVQMVGDTPYTYYELRKMIADSLLASCRFDDILFEMKRKHLLEETETGYQKYYPYMVDWINTGLTSEREKGVIRKRISDKKLEEIGKDYNVSRQRIEQIEKKAKRKFVRFKEEEYLYWYKTYDFTKEQFCTLFGILPTSYDAVKYLYGTDRLPKRKPVLEVLDDPMLTASMSKRLKNILTDQYVFLKDEYVPLKKYNVIDKIMEWKHSEDAVRVEDLINEYNDLLKEYHLPLEPLSENDDRSVEGYLARNPHTIKRQNRAFRYYMYENYDFEEFFAQIDFSVFMNKEISVQKIMVMYPELMEEYNIQVPYELHFIFQRYIQIAEQYGVTKGTAPNIVIGTATRENQITQFIFKVAPIPLDDFGKAYEEEYGVDAATVLGDYGDVYKKYLDKNRVIDVTQEPMRDDEFFTMSNALTEDLYFLEDVEQIYREAFPDGNIDKVNNYNLQKLGFNVLSTYMIRNTYSSVDECVTKMILQKGEIDTNTFDRRFNTIQFYYMALDKLRSTFEVLEVTRGRYITFERFHEKHPEITKEDLKDYATKAASYSEKDIYTVHSLKLAGFTHKIDSIKEPEYFFAGLIRSILTGHSSWANGALFFSKSDPAINKRSFLQYLLEEIGHDGVEITELMVYMIDEYGLCYDRYDIPRFIHELGYYYSTDSEKIYISEEEYLKEIN